MNNLRSGCPVPGTGQGCHREDLDTWDIMGTVPAKQDTIPGGCKPPHPVDDASTTQPKRAKPKGIPGLDLRNMGQQVQGAVQSEAGGAQPVPTGGEPEVTGDKKGQLPGSACQEQKQG